jgi:hypothetical protein
MAVAALLATAYAVSAPADAQHSEVVAAALEHGVDSSDPALRGIWKAAVPPPGSMHGEFDSNDPIGLAAGVKIWADCSINWVDPDAGRLYCFSSATSLNYFLDSPHQFLARAGKQWGLLNQPH